MTRRRIINNGLSESQEIHRALPCSQEAEEGFLGSLIIGGFNAVMDNLVVKPRASSFHLPAHKLIFKAMEFMASKNQPCDLILLTNELKRRNILDQVGGPAAITSLFTVTPTAANADYYASIIEEKRIFREVISTCSEAASSAYNGVRNSKEFLDQLEQRVLQIGENRGQESVTELAVEEFLAQVKDRRDGTFKGGLYTGIRPWDRIGGIFHSRLYGIIARPGNGKTSLLEQVMVNLLVKFHPVLVFQKDMPRDRFIGRMACRASNISYYLYEKGTLTDEQYERIEGTARELKELPIYIYDPGHLTAQDVHSIVRKEKRQHGIKVWFLDYIQLLNISEDRRNGLTSACIELKNCVNQTKIPGVVVAQLNREGSKGKPSAAMIKEFDQLHADAGVIFCLYSDKDQHELKPREPMPVNFLTDKNNFGPVNNSTIWFNRFMMTFEDRKPEWEDIDDTTATKKE